MQWARQKKALLFEDERRRILKERMIEESNKPWNSKELWEYAKKRGSRILQMESGDPNKEFQMINFQEPVIRAMLLYFTDNKKFEELDPKEFNSGDIPFSLNKGLWLWGVPGVGKTLLMEMFRINKRLSFGLVQCPKLAYTFISEGEKIIAPHSRVVKNGEIFQTTPWQHEYVGICYNDLGTETIPINHYANKINLMEQIILNTYEKKVPFWHRHITTNLTAEQVESVYGARVKDRIRQMFNIIDIKGQSLRR